MIHGFLKSPFESEKVNCSLVTHSTFVNKCRKRIVYYVPRGRGGGKVGGAWTVHSSCKLPRLRLGWQFRRAVGWPICLPWCVYYFSSYPGRKSVTFNSKFIALVLL